MRKVLVSIVISSFLLAGCGSSKRIDGKVYETYGVFNKEEVRDPNIEYSLIFGNAIWGILLFETAIAPIYFYGFSLYEPVGKVVQNNPIAPDKAS